MKSNMIMAITDTSASLARPKLNKSQLGFFHINVSSTFSLLGNDYFRKKINWSYHYLTQADQKSRNGKFSKVT